MAVELLYQLSGEGMPPPKDENEDENEITVTENAQQRLLSSAKWMNFLGALGIIGAAFGCLISLIVILVFSFAPTPPNSVPQPPHTTISIYAGMLIICIILFCLALMLYNTAKKIKRSLVFKDSKMLELALTQQKKLFKNIAIVYLVAIAVGIISMVAIELV